MHFCALCLPLPSLHVSDFREIFVITCNMYRMDRNQFIWLVRVEKQTWSELSLEWDPVQQQAQEMRFVSMCHYNNNY